MENKGTVQEVQNNKRSFSINKLFVEKNIPEMIYFLWEVSPATMKGEFKKHGVVLETDKDISALINLYETGNDIKGVIVTKDNRVLAFDTKKVILSMDIPANDLNTKGSNINWIA